MGRFFTNTSSNKKDKYKKRSIPREIVIGPTAIKFITVAIFATLALVYLSQSTAGANRSMRMSELNAEQAELELQKERLEVEKYRLQSLNEINANIEKVEMEKTSQVLHLDTAYNLAKN